MSSVSDRRQKNGNSILLSTEKEGRKFKINCIRHLRVCVQTSRLKRVPERATSFLSPELVTKPAETCALCTCGSALPWIPLSTKTSTKTAKINGLDFSLLLHGAELLEIAKQKNRCYR